MSNAPPRRWLVIFILLLLIIGILPYLVTWAITPSGFHFTGLIFNPQDGNSYVAKMRQGWEGSWRFHLPFTPEEHAGAYLFLYHLFLGHLARTLRLPLILVYHGARLLTAGAMLVAIYTLAGELTDQRHERRTMVLFAAIGSGLGWLASAFGLMSADLWITEAFPIYSLLSNAHFPLAIGLMAGMGVCGLRLLRQETDRSWVYGLVLAAGGIALGAVQPFGLVPTFGGLGLAVVAHGLRERTLPWRAIAWTGTAALLALPYPIYMQWTLQHDPVLSAWTAQNVTLSPPIWEWLLGFGVLAVLGTLGGIFAARRGTDSDWLTVGWTLVTLVGMYLPLPLQRRISLGWGVPLGLLAGVGWWRVVRPQIAPRLRGSARTATLAFSALTPLFLITITVLSAMGGQRWFTLSQGEWKGIEWLHEESASDAVVLCAPQTGLFIPAWAGQRVVYGHPFETVDAKRRQEAVEAYWRGEMSVQERDAFLAENDVMYVFEGPRERALGDVQPDGERVYDTADVRIYAINGR